MRQLTLKNRKPRKVKIIDKRRTEFKNPHYLNKYIWEFDENYIQIKADVSDKDNITWETTIFENDKAFEKDEENTKFISTTLQGAIDSAKRYIERCNLEKEEYITT